MTDKFNRTHGSTGTEPPDGKEFQQDERPDESHFDWFWYNVHTKINSLIDEVNNRLKQSNYTPVSDVDGEVDNAANSVAGLDDEVATKASDNHDNTAHSETYALESDVSSIQSSSDVDHDQTQGGTDSDAHHTRYSDEEARDAISGSFNTDIETFSGTGTKSVSGNPDFFIPSLVSISMDKGGKDDVNWNFEITNIDQSANEYTVSTGADLGFGGGISVTTAAIKFTF